MGGPPKGCSPDQQEASHYCNDVCALCTNNDLRISGNGCFFVLRRFFGDKVLCVCACWLDNKRILDRWIKGWVFCINKKDFFLG